MMLGKHLIAHWSSTQSVIALSSAEAELNALAKMLSEALGLRSMLREMNKEYRIRLYTDSSASNGMVHREGCGKVKYLDARQLCIQEYVGNKDVEVVKIPREQNSSDLTHHWGYCDGSNHLSAVGVVWL